MHYFGVFVANCWWLLRGVKRLTGRNASAEEKLLRAILQHYPWWARGHLLLARVTIANHNVLLDRFYRKVVFASANAAISLSNPNSKISRQAARLVADMHALENTSKG